MGPTTPLNDDADPSGGGARRGLWALLMGVVIAAALGALLHARGLGWFGARVLFGAEVPVHVLNLGDAAVAVQVPFASARRVAPGSMETVESLVGPITIAIAPEGGGPEERVQVDATGQVFHVVGGSECFAVFDLSALYGEDETGGIVVLDRIQPTQRTYVFDADLVVLPRRTAPPAAGGRVHWIEPVSCHLLDPEEEPFLLGRALIQLKERRDRQDEELRRAREAVPSL